MARRSGRRLTDHSGHRMRSPRSLVRTAGGHRTRRTVRSQRRGLRAKGSEEGGSVGLSSRGKGSAERWRSSPRQMGADAARAFVTACTCAATHRPRSAFSTCSGVYGTKTPSLAWSPPPQQRPTAPQPARLFPFWLVIFIAAVRCCLARSLAPSTRWVPYLQSTTHLVPSLFADSSSILKCRSSMRPSVSP